MISTGLLYPDQRIQLLVLRRLKEASAWNLSRDEIEQASKSTYGSDLGFDIVKSEAHVLRINWFTCLENQCYLDKPMSGFRGRFLLFMGLNELCFTALVSLVVLFVRLVLGMKMQCFCRMHPLTFEDMPEALRRMTFLAGQGKFVGHKVRWRSRSKSRKFA